jgi:hypothetical protein
MRVRPDDKRFADATRGPVSRHPLYRTYANMIRRCYSPNTNRRQYYYDRGITVCDRWRENFWNFVDDMGPKPFRTQLDRIDPLGNYEPGNVRWATLEEQSQNRIITPKSVCPSGHPLTCDEEVLLTKSGRRVCRECSRIACYANLHGISRDEVPPRTRQTPKRIKR